MQVRAGSPVRDIFWMMGIRRLVIVLAALAPACSLFVSVDGLSGGDAIGDGGTTTDGPTSSDGGTTSDAPIGTNDGGGPTPDGGGNAYATAILSDGPIGYWRFEETSGTTAHDEIGAHDGTYVGGFALGTPGIAGNSATFNGTTACVLIGGGSTFVFADGAPYTVEAWVNVPDISGGKRPPIGWIVSSELLNPNPYPRYGWSTYIDPNGFADGDGWNADVDGSFIYGGYSFNSSGSPIDPSTWTQVVATYNTSDHFEIYVNGNPRDGSGSTALLATHAGGLSIGCRDASNPSFLFTGSIDEVSVYDKELSASRILAHYQAATTK